MIKLLPKTEQRIFILSWLSNGVSGIEGSQEELQKKLTEKVTHALADKTVQGYIGEWDIVWGPVVYIAPKDKVFATNSMYVARNNNKFVVAVAGTNFKSKYDWLVEDGSVRHQEKWSYSNPHGLEPKISYGTNVGLDILLKMKSSGKTLLEFLAEAVRDSFDANEIIFTGHSLGGALSPTLALAVLDQQQQWSSGNTFKISVYPSAGPTPGNQDFSTYYNNRLGASTTRIWNKIDIVPHAWNEYMLSEIPNLYKPEIQPGLLVYFLVDIIAKWLAKDGNYTQLLPETPGLNGKVTLPIPSPSICNPHSPAPTLTDEEVSQFVEKLIKENPHLEPKIRKLLNSSDNWKEELEESLKKFSIFFDQLRYQHVEQYFVLLDIVEPYCYLHENKYSDKPSTHPNLSELEKLVIRLLELYESHHQ